LEEKKLNFSGLILSNMGIYKYKKLSQPSTDSQKGEASKEKKIVLPSTFVSG